MIESVLIMYSSERVGDSLVENLIMGMRDIQCIHWVDSDSKERLDSLDPEKIKPDVVIVLESLDAFISHRLRIGGRPWVLAASFTFDDVYTLYANSIAITEIGIDAFMSNCSAFLKNMTSMIPSVFFWRPIPGRQDTQHQCLIGSVIDNLLDRDFSLIDYAFKVLEAEKLSERAVVYCHKRVDIDRLPERIQKYAVEKIPGCWNTLKYYLPAPRITDMRGGVIPPEILKALAYGCHPLCFGHNALALNKIFTPQLTHLREFNNALKDAAAGKFETYHLVEKHGSTAAVKLEPLTADLSWRPTVSDFCKTVMNMYRRARANASP